MIRMLSPDIYRLAADAILLLHVAVVLFIVVGLALILVGSWRRWGWVRGCFFRLAHVAAIAYVALQSWVGMACPLTVLESWLRVQAGQGAYRRSFIEDWLQRLLYYDLPAWVFVLVYSLFAGVVLLAWIFIPPRRRK